MPIESGMRDRSSVLGEISDQKALCGHMWIILIFIISGIFCILKVTNLNFNNTTPGSDNSNIWKLQDIWNAGNFLSWVNFKMSRMTMLKCYSRSIIWSDTLRKNLDCHLMLNVVLIYTVNEPLFLF